MGFEIVQCLALLLLSSGGNLFPEFMQYLFIFPNMLKGTAPASLPSTHSYLPQDSDQWDKHTKNVFKKCQKSTRQIIKLLVIHACYAIAHCPFFSPVLPTHFSLLPLFLDIQVLCIPRDLTFGFQVSKPSPLQPLGCMCSLQQWFTPQPREPSLNLETLSKKNQTSIHKLLYRYLERAAFPDAK